MELIEIGAIDDETGLKIRGIDQLFSDIAHAIEDLPAPDALKVALPDLTTDNWAAFTRLTTLIYDLFNRNSSPQH